MGKQCDLEFNFADETRRFLPLLIDGYNTSSIPRFGELKFYVNSGTLIKLDALIDSQKQKLSAYMDGAIITHGGYSGIEFQRKKIARLKNLRKSILALVEKGKDKVEIEVGNSLYNSLYAVDDRGSNIIQALHVSIDGYNSLDQFLKEYIFLYSSRDLEKQETLELPTNYSTILKSHINSRVAKYGSTKIPVNLIKPFQYPVHSLLYLDSLGYISIKKMQRKEDVPTTGSGTIYRSLYWEWQAVVDIVHKQEESIFVYAGIQLDCKKATLTVRNPVAINPENQEIKLLKAMFVREGVVKYVELAKAMGLNAFNPDSNNSDLSRVVQDRMKILKNLLLSAGMTEDEVRDRVVVKNKVGYQLRNINLNN